MQTKWTNHESGKTMTVFVHSTYHDDGVVWLKVNKGASKSPAVFAVRAEDTDFTPTATVFA